MTHTIYPATILFLSTKTPIWTVIIHSIVCYFAVIGVVYVAAAAGVVDVVAAAGAAADVVAAAGPAAGSADVGNTCGAAGSNCIRFATLADSIHHSNRDSVGIEGIRIDVADFRTGIAVVVVAAAAAAADAVAAVAVVAAVPAVVARVVVSVVVLDYS